MALQRKAKILSNQPVGKNYFRLKFTWPQLAKEAKPGQFIQVRIDDSLEPLLRRPFGIHRICGNGIEILYEVVGKGTEKLSRKKPGEILDILGPLGNGFKMPTPYLPRRQAGTLHPTPCILVAGGIGVAPLTFLAERLAKGKNKKAKLKTLVLIGAKTKNHILCADEFKKLGCEVKIATDDGSLGYKGYVSGLLKHTLSTFHGPWSMVYSCGPRPMLKEVSKICITRNIRCQASFEENIACGIGACLGCAIKTKAGFKRVCLDGPVFDIKEVLI